MGEKKFKRQNRSKHKRVKDSWRSPRGGDNKTRKQKKGKPPIVKVGYRKPKSERNVHPSGYREVLVHNTDDLDEIDPETQAARVASSVGQRKKIKILEKAEEKEIKVLNPGRREKNGSEDAEESSS